MKGQTIIGIILVALGMAFLLDMMEIIGFYSLLSIYWPIFLIIIGANHFYSKRYFSTSGLILILAGLFFFLKNLKILPKDIGNYIWPIILIIIGAAILFSRRGQNKIPINKDNTFNHFVFFSGLGSNNISDNFRGGNATAIFGGIDLDLRKAELSKEGAYLDLTTAFGGIDVRVPNHWKVVVEGTPIFGGWSNETKTVQADDQEIPILQIKCLAIFGGIEIKN